MSSERTDWVGALEFVEFQMDGLKDCPAPELYTKKDVKKAGKKLGWWGKTVERCSKNPKKCAVKTALAIAVAVKGAILVADAVSEDGGHDGTRSPSTTPAATTRPLCQVLSWSTSAVAVKNTSIFLPWA